MVDLSTEHNKHSLHHKSLLWSYGSRIYNYLCNQCLSHSHSIINHWRPSWLWSYSSRIYNYLCNQCLSHSHSIINHWKHQQQIFHAYSGQTKFQTTIGWRKSQKYRNEEKMDDTTRAMIFNCHWKSWVGTNNLIYCNSYNVHSLFQNFMEEVFFTW